jgi:hypothetical protein
VTVGTLTPELAGAVEELEEAFPDRVSVETHDAGGVVIRVRNIELSDRWIPATGDLWFVLPFHYPDAPIYPHHVTGATPTSLVPALQAVNWRGMAVTQVSLRHSAWTPTSDTAVGCVLATLSWLRAT